jgi:HK97 family phage major capsid protein
MNHEERNKLLAEASTLLKKTNFTREDSSRVESILSLSDRYVDTTDLKRTVMAQRDRELGRTREAADKTTPVDQEFRDYFFAPSESMARDMAAQRAQSVGTDSAGGYITPQPIADRVEVMLKKTDGLFDASTLFTPPRGTAVNFPVLEDTGHSAAIVTEGSASATGPDITFAAVAFGRVSTYRSGIVGVSLELYQDSAYDLGNLIADSVTPAFARGVGAAFTATLLTSASSGVTAGSATVIAPDELYSLIDSVDESYQANASCLMRRSTLTALRKLKTTGGGNYLFPEARDADGYPTLLGYRVYVSPSMGALSTGAKPISFGDHSKFIRRQVANSFTVRRYVERYAELGQITFEAFMRTDGGLAKSATTMPVKVLQMA